MRSGADYIFSIFQNHNCPPDTIFFGWGYFFLLKSSTVSHFQLQTCPLTPNKMQVVQDSSHFYKPPSFHGDSLTALAQLRVVCTKIFQYPRWFLAQPLLPMGSQGNSSKISQGLCKKAGNLQKVHLTMNLSLSSERKKNPPVEHIGKTTAQYHLA